MESRRAMLDEEENRAVSAVQDTSLTIISINQNDYICITDMAKARTGSARGHYCVHHFLS